MKRLIQTHCMSDNPSENRTLDEFAHVLHALEHIGKKISKEKTARDKNG